MEISAALKSDIKNIQGEIAKAIQDHQNLALKVKEFPDLGSQIKQDLCKIQKHIIELNDKQKVLVQQLRKEIDNSISNGQFVTVFNFNLYKIKPGQLEPKKRRRKDLSLAPKVVTCRPTHSPPSLSPSPTPSSSSSLSDDSVEYVSPFMLPVPVPRAMLLPDVKENVYLGSVSRRDLRPPKVKRNQKALSDEEVCKDIPVFYDPLPSPPPTDEKDLKARVQSSSSALIEDSVTWGNDKDSNLIKFGQLKEININENGEDKKNVRSNWNKIKREMNLKGKVQWHWEIFMAALSLIPKEMLHEILNRKVERKRRSTATNNPNFVYNNDWEIPAWKRSRTYLSPHKLGKIETPVKKIKNEDNIDGCSKQSKKESECDKPGKMCLEDVKLPGNLTVDKSEGKSRNSTPDSISSNLLCFVCHASGLLNVCKECSVGYHSSCVSPNSGVSCPCCKHKRSSPDEGSSEESSKEEFASKCPNVAESYSKLKEYIENHTDSDTAVLYTERENYKIELLTRNHELYSQKRELEEKAAELSEALLLQEDVKNNLRKEEERILAKIKVIVDFVTQYQKTNPKKPTAKDDSKTDGSVVESLAGNDKDDKKSTDPEGEPEKKSDGKGDKLPENCESPASWKESGDNSQTNFYSPEQFSQESTANSPITYDNFDSSSQMSKGSLANENVESKSLPSSKESGCNPLFELEEGDYQFTSQSIDCSTESEEIDYESSIE